MLVKLRLRCCGVTSVVEVRFVEESDSDCDCDCECNDLVGAWRTLRIRLGVDAWTESPVVGKGEVSDGLRA